jgi:ABC-type nitrate/sulfonate/bicarbonate transport system substrate-binding protein
MKEKDIMRLKVALPSGFIALLMLAMTWSINEARASDDGFIRYTTEPTGSSLLLWYAEENGLFQKYGLKYGDTLINTAFLGLQSIGAGQNDASIQSDPPTVTNIGAGIDAVVVAVVSKSVHNLELIANKPYASLKDLKGKKVAWLAGTGGEYGLMKYLEANHMSLKDFQHVNLQPSEAIPSLIAGNVDAIWYWQPWPRKAMQLGAPNVNEIWKSIPEQYEPNFILTVGRSFAQGKPETLKKFLRVLIDAEEALKKDPKQGEEILIRRLRVSPAEAKLALGDYPPDINLTGRFVQELGSIADVFAKQGRLKSMPDWNKVVNTSFLQSVAPDRVKNVP